MDMFTTPIAPVYGWLMFAVLLALGELLAPGVFLIWVAAAAAATGLLAFLLPIPLWAQFLLFAAITVAAVIGGRRWYVATNKPVADPLLNDRAARMVGQIVTVVQPVSSASGRVKVGDGEWPARGPAMAVGTTARIVVVRDGVVEIEPAGA